MRHLFFASALFAASLAACTTPPAAPGTALSPGVDWVANNPGWGEEAQAVFAEATSYIEHVAATRETGSWAVALDLDETVMNNVAYQIRIEQAGETYSSESWHAWTQEQSATLVPGAKAFVERVNALGGHIAFVTNRSDVDQLATEANLAALGIDRSEDFRALLTRARPDGASNKTPRFAIIPAMLAAQGYPGVELVAFIGDNVGDKPDTLGAAQFFCIDQGAMYGEPCAAVPGPGKG